MGLEIINTAGNARLAAPSIRLPASLSGARGFFAMGGDLAASARNRVPGRLAERGTVVGAPVASAGYCRFRHQVNYLNTVFPGVAYFTLAGIFRAPVAFPATADRPIFFGNTVSGGTNTGIILNFQAYTETPTPGMSILAGASYDNGGGVPATRNTQILNNPNPLGWKLVIFTVSSARQDIWNITDNLTAGSTETRPRLTGVGNMMIGGTYIAANVGAQADICNLLWLPGVAATEAQRADIAALLRADAALVGITA